MSILQCSPEDFEFKKQEICLKLARFIVDTYERTLRDQVVSEIIRRLQFRHLLRILECYEMLQIYCNLNQERQKGITVKAQAIKLIVLNSKPAKGQAPRIFSQTISKLIKEH